MSDRPSIHRQTKKTQSCEDKGRSHDYPNHVPGYDVQQHQQRIATGGQGDPIAMASRAMKPRKQECLKGCKHIGWHQKGANRYAMLPGKVEQAGKINHVKRDLRSTP